MLIVMLIMFFKYPFGETFSTGMSLCHEHPLIRPVIWENVIPDSFSYPIIIHCIFISAALFLVCAGIDYARELIFKTSGINNMEKKLAERILQPFTTNKKQ